MVGGGLAGLRAALSARQSGARVIVVGKRHVGRSGSSVNTTGGYAAVMSELNSDDDKKLHLIDTIVGGGFVNDRRLVRSLVGDAPDRLRELLALGISFAARWPLSPFAERRPHTKSRAQPQEMRHRRDLPLREAAVAAGVEFIEDCAVLDLLRDEDRIVGAMAAHRFKVEGYILRARSTVLALGGAGEDVPDHE